MDAVSIDYFDGHLITSCYRQISSDQIHQNSMRSYVRVIRAVMDSRLLYVFGVAPGERS